MSIGQRAANLAGIGAVVVEQREGKIVIATGGQAVVGAEIAAKAPSALQMG